MTRDHIVSVRLADDERSQLAKLGRPADVIRDMIRRAFAPPLAYGQSVGFVPPDTVWSDGPTGRTWPEPLTR